jgi:hypothetical protein
MTKRVCLAVRRADFREPLWVDHYGAHLFRHKIGVNVRVACVVARNRSRDTERRSGRLQPWCLYPKTLEWVVL